MANITSVASTYAGNAATPYISRALLGAKTIAQDGVTVYPNIKRREVIKRLDMSNLLQAYSCDFSASGSLVITEVVLQPVEFKINKQECVNTFKQTWDAERMRAGASSQDIPFNQFIVDQIIANTAQANELLLWRGQFQVFTGDLAYLNLAKGYLKILFDADLPGTAGGVNEPVTVNSTTLTAANIIAEIGAVYQAIPDQIKDSPELRLYVSPATGGLYRQAVASVQKNDTNSNPTLMYLDLPIIVCPGMLNNQMVCAERTNLFFGTDLVSDWNEVKVIDMSENDGSDNVRYKLKFTFDTAIGYVPEVVYYRPAK
jgi:hypothetical protein